MTSFEIQDIHLNSVIVTVYGDGIALDGKRVFRIFPHPDGTIELDTSEEQSERPLTYFLHGYQFWRIYHDGQPPSEEYAGQLEAKLAYIQQITTNTPGKTIIEATTPNQLQEGP